MTTVAAGWTRAVRAMRPRIDWPRVARSTAIAAGAVVAIKLVLAALNSHSVIAAQTPASVVLLGVIQGMTYGLLAVGLVLIYRSNRVINFAHGNIGAFAAAFFSLAAAKWHLPYWIAFVLALAVAAVVGMGAETAAVRRLRGAPLLMSVVVTLGIGQFLGVFALVINGTSGAGSSYPNPSFMPTFNVGALYVTPAYTAMLVLSPIVVVVLAFFLRVSRFGLGIRAAAENTEAARMAGIFAGRMSSLSWAIAGALSAFTAILIAPTTSLTSGDSFGPSLILRAMAAAALGRMDNMPVAFAGGIGLGVIEQVVLWNYPQAGLVEMSLLVVVLATLLLQRQRAGRAEDKGSWAAVQALRPLPAAVRNLPAIRALGPLLSVAFFGLLALLPVAISNGTSVTFVYFMAAAIVGLSIGLLTGLGGQLTLGQFMIGAVGAVAAYQVSSRVGQYPLAVLYAGLAGAVAAVIIGLPALRIRGLMLAVTTLAFGTAGSAYLLPQSYALGEGVDPGQVHVLGLRLTTAHQYYYFALVLFVLCFVLCANVRRSGFARTLIAVRDNEPNAKAFTVNAAVVKVQGNLVAGFVAGIGGAVFAYSLSQVGADAFPAGTSIDVVVMSVLGGISSLAGPILGCAWVIGLPQLPQLGNLGLAATYFGATGIILWRPAGLIGFADYPRQRLAIWLAQRHGIDLDAAPESAPDAAPMIVRPRPVDDGGIQLPHQPVGGRTRLLEARDLVKRFGGVHAVNGVSLHVNSHETLGLIGPNGAGKTTTFELLGGFTKPDSGTVMFRGRDISHLGPEARAERGLIRSFQDAALFPTMTVTDTVMLAHERNLPSSFLGAAFGIGGRTERAKAAHTRELLGMLGLTPYADKQIRELSTGTRRITEIACLIALEPTCLLLDEPSSGIAQRETEALGALIADLKTQLGLTLVVIEHDIPLIMGISDRIVAMADGTVICDGTPEQVRNDPQVVDAYLGGSIDAIERSGART